MDITADFKALVSIASQNEVQRKPRAIAPSPFVWKSAEIFAEMLAFEGLLRAAFEDFVGYHSHWKDNLGEQKSMSEEDRDELYQEITSFITAVGAELKDMKDMIARLVREGNNKEDNEGRESAGVSTNTDKSPTSKACKMHYHEILAFLTSRLGLFTKKVRAAYLDLIKLCYGYHIYHRVVHWRANSGLQYYSTIQI